MAEGSGVVLSGRSEQALEEAISEPGGAAAVVSGVSDGGDRGLASVALRLLVSASAVIDWQTWRVELGIACANPSV